jgi:hypothetical protein
MEVYKRFAIFKTYCLDKYCKETALKNVSQENLNILNETLKIRDFIVLGNENFNKKIKDKENMFTHKKIAYLSISQIRDYLKKKKQVKKRNFTYFIIIENKEAENLYKEIYTIRDSYCLVLSLIIFINDEQTLINKIPFQNYSHLPIFIAKNINDIINYINSQENLSCSYNFVNQSSYALDKIEYLSSLKKNNNS